MSRYTQSSDTLLTLSLNHCAVYSIEKCAQTSCCVQSVHDIINVAILQSIGHQIRLFRVKTRKSRLDFMVKRIKFLF